MCVARQPSIAVFSWNWPHARTAPPRSHNAACGAQWPLEWRPHPRPNAPAPVRAWPHLAVGKASQTLLCSLHVCACARVHACLCVCFMEPLIWLTIDLRRLSPCAAADDDAEARQPPPHRTQTRERGPRDKSSWHPTRRRSIGGPWSPDRPTFARFVP